MTQFKSFVLTLSVSLLIVALIVVNANAQTQEAEFVPGEILVKFKETVQTAQIQSTFSNAGLEQREYISAIGLYRCSISDRGEVNAAVRACQTDANVEYAEPNYIYRTSSARPMVANVPDDPRFSELWGMQNSNDADIDADEAWDVQTGSKEVLIGVIDTGVDYNHEDLQANMWRNPGESGDGKENNGVDDDGNGFVDDVFGWDFNSNDNDPMDDNGHGTHVSGTIGAVGNNGTGVVGVNWQVTIMALKFLDANGSGSTDNAVSAIIYAAENGAVITSNSWGGAGGSQALEDAIEFARDRNSLFVAAAGNSSLNTDNFPNFPSNYETENVVSVAASDRNDQLASFSNFGKRTVDLAAPGVDILSCQPGNGYQVFSGTSMATPHVSGVAGLILAQYPGLNYRQVMIRVLGGVDPKSQFDGNTVTGGRLNAADALSTDPLVFVTPVGNTADTAGPYAATAEAIDDSQIASMTLNYSINNGANESVTMQKVADDKYSADIPGQPLESTIEYFVEAQDNDGNTTRSSTFSFRITEEGDDEGCFNFAFSVPSSGDTTTRGVVFLANLLLLIGLILITGKTNVWTKLRKAIS